MTRNVSYAVAVVMFAFAVAFFMALTVFLPGLLTAVAQS
jgi:hypothetical protein